MEQGFKSKRIRFKVPKGIQSKHNETESPVAFKNLTDDHVALYWVDFQGKPSFYAELNPVNRTDDGFQITTYMTHPWVAIYKGKSQAFLNGRRYFFPPNPDSWKQRLNGWMNLRWNLISDDNVEDDGSEKYYEVLILAPGNGLLVNNMIIFCHSKK